MTSVLLAPCASRPVRQGEKALTKYYLATRRAFSDASYIQLSLDASSVMGKSMVFGLAALPDNQAVVYPPQVALVGGGSRTCLGSCSTRSCGLYYKLFFL